MKRVIFLMFVMCSILLFADRPAQAALITIDFEVSGFGVGAPDDPVSGAIAYISTSSRGAIGEIKSINLTIDGHTYSIGELVTFTSIIVYPARDIGGAVGGVLGLTPGVNDFTLWMRAREYPLYRPPPIDQTYPILDLAPEHFAYTTPNYPDSTYTGDHFTYFRVTETPVPEPSTLLLLGSGLVGLVGYGRRRFKK